MKEEAVNKILNASSFLKIETIKDQYNANLIDATTAIKLFFATRLNNNEKNKFKNNCFLQVNTIAEQLCINPKTCRNAIDELIKKKILIRYGKIGERKRKWGFYYDGCELKQESNAGDRGNHNAGDRGNQNKSNAGDRGNPTTVNSSTSSKSLLYVKKNTENTGKQNTVIKKERCLEDKLDLKAIDIKDERSLVKLYYSILYNLGFVELSKLDTIDKEYKLNNITINWDIRSAKDLLDYFGRTDKGYKAIKYYIKRYYTAYIKDRKELNVETTYLSCFRNWIKKTSDPDMPITTKKDILDAIQPN